MQCRRRATASWSRSAAGSGKVRWRSTIGPSESSPLVHGGAVYVGDWNGRVSRYSAATGKLVWGFQADGKVKDGLALSGNRVFFGTYGSKVYALDARPASSSGRRARSRGSAHRATFYSTPAVAYDRVYIGSTDGKMYSFGASTRRPALVAVDRRLRLRVAGGLAAARLRRLVLGLVLLLRRGDGRRPLVVPGERADLGLGRRSSRDASTSRR